MKTEYRDLGERLEPYLLPSAPKAIHVIVEAAEKTLDYMALCGRVPTNISLTREQYIMLNELIIKRSGGARDLDAVRYRGVKFRRME